MASRPFSTTSHRIDHARALERAFHQTRHLCGSDQQDHPVNKRAAEGSVDEISRPIATVQPLNDERLNGV